MDKKEQGKKNRAEGAKFELKVRKDLESKGWIVTKWCNNVDLDESKLISAKHKFNVFSRVMSLGTGFPDFLAYKPGKLGVVGIECKVNGYLKPLEKKKMQWLRDNNIFNDLTVASKGVSLVIYKPFGE